MHRILPFLFAPLLFAGMAAAQCTNLTGWQQITAWNWAFLHDDGISTQHIPLPFAFPIAGAAAASFTHLRVGSNGWVLLTDGTNSPGMPLASSGGYGSIANSSNGLGGAAGDFPLLAPFWGDLVWTPHANNGVFLNDQGSSVTVVWQNVRDYNAPAATAYSFGVELFGSGQVRFHYGPGVDNRSTQGLTNHVGLSARNQQVAPAASDFFPGPASAPGGMVWQSFPVGTFDGADSSLVLLPAAGGWTSTVCNGAAATTTSQGAGCYDVPRSGFYQEFADAAVASAALQGNVLQLTRSVTGYTAAWLPNLASALYVAPTAAATSLSISDDGFAFVGASPPLPTPNGPFGGVRVWANGAVTFGYNFLDRSPSGAEFAAMNQQGFFSWHDFDPTEPGSGSVRSERVGSALYITWDGVESRSTPAGPNPSRMQFQFDLLTGNVMLVWVAVDTDTTSQDGSGYLVGVKGSGPITDPGSQALSSGPPATSNWLAALAFRASEPLVYGSSVTFSTDHVPEFQLGSGVRVCLHILSTGGSNGFDLGAIGAPGCSAYVNSLDLVTPVLGTTPTLSSVFSLPISGPLGLQLFSQSVALALGGLPNAQNTAGLVTSNGLQHRVSFY